MKIIYFLIGLIVGMLGIFLFYQYKMKEIRINGSILASELIEEKMKRKNDSIEYNEMLDMCQQRIIEITENTK